MSHEPATGSATILVVDDNEANRALAHATLDDEGYRVLLASDGSSAVATFERERPDCVLLDVRMPGVDSVTACERIRQLDADVPVLFLTAQRDVDTFDRALRVGGTDFLTKPFRPVELLVRAASALTVRRLHAQARGHYELLKRQRDELLRLQLQKERLTAFIVHDLKNPVNSIDLHAQFLLGQRALPELARDSVQQIRADAGRLVRMIMNLLDISKADEGKLAPRAAEVELSRVACAPCATRGSSRPRASFAHASCRSRRSPQHPSRASLPSRRRSPAPGTDPGPSCSSAAALRFAA